MNTTDTTHAVKATDVVAGDVVQAGHGYGEAPAVVLHSARFTARTWTVMVTDGPVRTRTLSVAHDHTFDVVRDLAG